MSARSRGLIVLVAGILLCLGSGCASIRESPLEVQLMSAPSCLRDDVYPIFVLSPIDAFDVGGMEKFADYVRSRGFQNTELFIYYDGGDAEALAARIREIRCQNPRARILLTGFSSGCLIIHNALCLLEPESIGVDRVCYIDSFTFKMFKRDPHPENFGYASLVYRRKNPAPTDIPRSTIHYINAQNHFNAPTHPHTMHVVMSHLCDMTGQPY